MAAAVRLKVDWAEVWRLYFAAGRARWGAGGALNPQPALAGLNSSSRSGASGLATIRGVDGKVPRGGER